MSNIQILISDLEAQKITISELQQQLSSCMYSALMEIDYRGNPNDAEGLIKTLDNELELVIYTLNPERQNSAAMKVLERAQSIIKKGFVYEPHS